ncbi:hypothetical protein CDIK_2968 [Cucumispora dikerogammari]|nr:hypothetical protein CDIK_2968 [Cucumispora dikerogammari]
MIDIYDDSNSDIESMLTVPLKFNSKPSPTNKHIPKNMLAKNKLKLELPTTPVEEAKDIIIKSFNTGIIAPIQRYHIECIPEFTGNQLNYKNAQCPQTCRTHNSLSNYLSHFPSYVDLVAINEMYVIRNDHKSKEHLQQIMNYYICQNDFLFLKQRLLKVKKNLDAHFSFFDFLLDLKKKHDWSDITALEDEIKKVSKVIDGLKINKEEIDLRPFEDQKDIKLEMEVKNTAKSIIRSLIYDYELEMILVNLFPMKMSIRINDLWPAIAASFNIPSVDILNFKKKIYEMENKNLLTKITKNDEYVEVIPVSSINYENVGDFELVKAYLKRNGVSEKDLKALDRFGKNFLHQKCMEIYECLETKPLNIGISQFNAELNSRYLDLIEIMDDTYGLSTYRRDNILVDLTARELLWIFYMKEIEQTEQQCQRIGITVAVNSNNIFKKQHD